jgi:F-type H+-transporting ATPase subunit alpha
LERGQRSIEILKQPQYEPLSMGRQAIIFYALNNGYLDEVPIPQCRAFEEQLRRYIETAAPELEGQIMEAGDITDELEEVLKKALDEFKATFAAS